MDLDQVERFVRATAPEHDDVQRTMAERARADGFPIIGPEVGGFLRLLARLTDAEQVFEFGSGFGYSASWFLRGGADHVVLTEHDADELALAREYLDRGDYGGRASFEAGDAVAVVDGYDGPFDVVLLDHQKHRYRAGFEKVRETVRPGGVVVADNVVRGPIDFEALLAHVESGEDLAVVNDETRGIADYLDAVRGAAGWETSVLALGNGVAVSVRVE